MLKSLEITSCLKKTPSMGSIQGAVTGYTSAMDIVRENDKKKKSTYQMKAKWWWELWKLSLLWVVLHNTRTDQHIWTAGAIFKRRDKAMSIQRANNVLN